MPLTRGRPPVKNPKKLQYRLRMTREDADKLEFCCKATGKTKADVLREGLERVYQALKIG